MPRPVAALIRHGADGRPRTESGRCYYVDFRRVDRVGVLVTGEATIRSRNGAARVEVRLEGEQIVRGLGRGRSGPDDGAVVLAHHVEPGTEIVGMSHGRHDAERRACERRRHLGDELLLGVLLRAERTGQVAAQPVLGARPVAELVQRGPMPVHRLEIGLRRRHLDGVGHHVVEGAIATDLDVRPGDADQGFGLRQDQPGLDRRSRCRDPVRKTVTLLGVEDREPLEKRDGLRVLAGLARTLALPVGNEAIGEHHRGPALALADAAAEGKGLPEGEPALRREAERDHRAPQDEHIDAGIPTPRRSVLRHRQRRPHRRGSPRLNPRHAAGRELGHDPGRDLLVEVGPVLRGSAASRGTRLHPGHGASP